MKRKTTTIIIGVILLLLIAVAVLALLNRGEGQLVGGQIEVFVQGESAAMLTPEDIYALPSVEVYKKIVSSGQENQEGTFTGVYLAELLDAATPGWQENAAQVICRAEDNFISSFALDEVLAPESVLVAYALDGELLTGKDQGGKGPFRLVVLDDEFGNRSTYWLCRVEVE